MTSVLEYYLLKEMCPNHPIEMEIILQLSLPSKPCFVIVYSIYHHQSYVIILQIFSPQENKSLMKAGIFVSLVHCWVPGAYLEHGLADEWTNGVDSKQ